MSEVCACACASRAPPPPPPLRRARHARPPLRPLSARTAVELARVATVQQGRVGARLERFGPSAECADAQQWLELRRGGGALEAMSGWLDKLGGAKGGRASWSKRWFVLHGTQLAYFASPADAKAKGMLDVSGASCAASRAEGRGAFSVSWDGGGDDGQPSRKLRADSPATAERWMAAIARVSRVAKSKAAAARAAGPRAPRLRAGGEGSAPLPSTQPDDERLCFTLVMSGGGGEDDDAAAAASGARSAHSFMAGSAREFEAWYGGLLCALDEREHGRHTAKNAPAREARWRALLKQRPDEAAAIGCLLAQSQEAQPDKRDAALVSYKAAAAADPMSPGARGGLGRLLLATTGAPAAALPHLEAAVLLSDYEEPQVVRAYGEALLALARAAPASSSSSSSSPGAGKAKGAATAAASAADYAKHAAAVLAHCAQLEAPARIAATSLLLGEAHSVLGRHDVAAAHLRDAAVLLGSAAALPLPLLRALAASLDATGGADEAATAASAAAALAASAPHAAGDAPALRRAAVAQLTAQGRWREVVAHAEALLADDPEGLEALLCVANAYLRAEAARAAGDERVGAGVKVTGAGKSTAARSSGGGGGGGRDATLEQDADDGDGDAGAAGARRGASATSSGSLPPVAGSLSLEPPPRGALAVDGLSPSELCTCAERHLVAALTLAPENPRANILCAQVYERLAALERDAEAAGSRAGGDAPPPTGDEVAASGWTPNQRLAKAEEWYTYVASAYADECEAPLLLGKLLKVRGRYDDAATYLRLVCERSAAGSAEHAEATSQLARVARLADGKPEVDEAAEKAARKAARAAARAAEEARVAAEEAAAEEVAAAAKAAAKAARAEARAKAAAEAEEAARAQADAEAAAAATKAAKARAEADAAAASKKKGAASPTVGKGKPAAAADDDDDGDAEGAGGDDGDDGAHGGGEDDDEGGAGFSGEIPMGGGGGGKKGKDAEIEMGAAVDAAAMAGLSQDERKKAYFKAMADAKKAKEEEEAKREKAKVAAMNPEERAEYERAQAEEDKRNRQKDKALTSGLGQYGKGGAAHKLLAARGGRGRGRGR